MATVGSDGHAAARQDPWPHSAAPRMVSRLKRRWPALVLVVVLLGGGALWLASHPFGPSFRVMRAWFPEFCNIDGRCRVEAVIRNDGAAGDGVVHFQFAQDHFDYGVIPPRLISTQTLSCTRVLARVPRDGMVAVGCAFVSGYDALLPYPAEPPIVSFTYR